MSPAEILARSHESRALHATLKVLHLYVNSITNLGVANHNGFMYVYVGSQVMAYDVHHASIYFTDTYSAFLLVA